MIKNGYSINYLQLIEIIIKFSTINYQKNKQYKK